MGVNMGFPLSLTASIFCLACVGWLIDRFRFPKFGRLRLPPGPKGYPIIGNLFDLPTYKPWLAYDRMFKTYGDMVYLNVFGQNFLILGSPKVTNDLFEKRSKNYSDRIRSPMILELMKWDFNFGLLPYGPVWRDRRRVFGNHFHQKVVSEYLPVQLRSIRAFIQNVLDSPERLDGWIHFSISSSVMKIMYGMEAKVKDPYVECAEEAMKGINEAAIPGKFWVDIFPTMKYIPDWFPGTGWKRRAQHWRNINHDVRFKAFNLVKNQMKKGVAAPSICRTLIENLPDSTSSSRTVKEEVAVDTCAVSYIGASESSSSVGRTFFMAMLLYPEAQKKGQVELDRVLNGRLPEPGDASSLPYINAMVKETLRWQPVAPLSIPHTVVGDDEYNGYFIPKGTIVFGNSWHSCMTRKCITTQRALFPIASTDDLYTANVILPSSINADFSSSFYPSVNLSCDAPVGLTVLREDEKFLGAFEALLDSGSTHHIFNNKDLFTTFDGSFSVPVSTANERWETRQYYSRPVNASTAVFGYGRRICPGRYFGLNALFLMIAHTLAVFDIKPALDEDGNEIQVKADMTSGLSSQPVPFVCRIVPRSKAAVDLIRRNSVME